MCSLSLALEEVSRLFEAAEIISEEVKPEVVRVLWLRHDRSDEILVDVAVSVLDHESCDLDTVVLEPLCRRPDPRALTVSHVVQDRNDDLRDSWS